MQDLVSPSVLTNPCREPCNLHRNLLLETNTSQVGSCPSLDAVKMGSTSVMSSASRRTQRHAKGCRGDNLVTPERELAASAGVRRSTGPCIAASAGGNRCTSGGAGSPGAACRACRPRQSSSRCRAWQPCLRSACVGLSSLHEATGQSAIGHRQFIGRQKSALLRAVGRSGARSQCSTAAALHTKRN